MTSQRKFLLGLAAGAVATFAGSQVVRRRRGIDFAGRVVVITGGSRGLGFVIARQLASQGAHLVLLARDPGELDRAARVLADTGADVTIVRCDVRRRADVRACMEGILEKFTFIDVLINNAGVIQVGPLDHMIYDDFENAMATHFWGPLNMMLEIVPMMRRRGFGRIVNITSIGGRIAVPHLAPYCASKFALVGLSDALRAELDQYGIRVTTVSPGLMRTGSPRNVQVKGRHEAEYAWFKISDSLPGLSISAERAAHRIIEACRYGDPELTITVQARLAAVANELAPNAVARAMAIAARLLPRPAGPEGNQIRRGFQSESRWTSAPVTALTEKAAVLNNEM